MKKLIAPFIFFILVTASCKKNSNTTTTPTYNFSSIDKILNDSVPVKFGGNCFAIINVDGQTVYSKTFGGYTADTRQLIASCTKWLSGALIMSLVDEGKIKLADSVGKYLPIFTTYGKGKVTIAQLFSHTSGFPTDSPQGYEDDQTLTLAKSVDSIAIKVPLLFVPGARFNYGGLSMHIAGRICEVATGKTWANIFAEKIATPCGMTNTDFGLVQNPKIAGGVRSMPNDYIKFLEMLRQNGVALNGTRVLSEAAVAAMEQPQTLNSTTFYSPYPTSLFITNGYYGIGQWRDLVTTNDVLIENCSPGAFGSHPWINRGKKVNAIIFTFIPVNGYISTLPTCLKIREAVRTIVQ